MGLDWCLRPRPVPGREAEFRRLLRCRRQRPLSREEERLWQEVAVDPERSLGVPQVGIHPEATAYFLETIVPSRLADAADEQEAAFWSQDPQALVEAHWGAYVMDLLGDYHLSTFQARPPFNRLAGLLSFRGQVVAQSPLLPQGLRERAYRDMTPLQMARYALSIERAALREAHRRLRAMGDAAGAAATAAGPHEAREWAAAVVQEASGLPPAEAFHSFWEPGDDREETALALLEVLDAARWLRFWADLGHSVHAWY